MSRLGKRHPRNELHSEAMTQKETLFSESRTVSLTYPEATTGKSSAKQVDLPTQASTPESHREKLTGAPKIGPSTLSSENSQELLTSNGEPIWSHLELGPVSSITVRNSGTNIISSPPRIITSNSMLTADEVFRWRQFNQELDARNSKAKEPSRDLWLEAWRALSDAQRDTLAIGTVAEGIRREDAAVRTSGIPETTFTSSLFEDLQDSVSNRYKTILKADASEATQAKPEGSRGTRFRAKAKEFLSFALAYRSAIDSVVAFDPIGYDRAAWAVIS